MTSHHGKELSADERAAFVEKVKKLVPLWRHVRTLSMENCKWRQALPHSSRFLALSRECVTVPTSLRDLVEQDAAGQSRTATALALQHAASELRLDEKIGEICLADLKRLYADSRCAPLSTTEPARREVRLAVFSDDERKKDLAFAELLRTRCNEKTRIGDVQVFAVPVRFAEHAELARWSDAIHSIWRAVDEPRLDSVAAYVTFSKCLILDTPVTRAALVSGAVIRAWPQHPRGFSFSTKPEAERLAEAISRANPAQSTVVRQLFGL